MHSIYFVYITSYTSFIIIHFIMNTVFYIKITQLYKIYIFSIDYRL